MFESLVVTLREGVEAALIVAIVVAYLRKAGRADLGRSVYIGLVAAVIASVGGAIAFRGLGLNEDLYEGWLKLISAFFIATIVIWMWRTAKHLKGNIEDRVGRITSRTAGKFSFGICAFVFLMVAREGIETVLLLSAVRLNSTALMNFIGALSGLGLAVLFGVLFVKGSIRINLRKFFSVTSIILILVSAQLLVSGLHDLSEAMILPSSEREMAIIGPIENNNAFFYIIILALTVFLLLCPWLKPAVDPAVFNPG
jgi:FTR1 family protein